MYFIYIRVDQFDASFHYKEGDYTSKDMPWQAGAQSENLFSVLKARQVRRENTLPLTPLTVFHKGRKVLNVYASGNKSVSYADSETRRWGSTWWVPIEDEKRINAKVKIEDGLLCMLGTFKNAVLKVACTVDERVLWELQQEEE